MVGGRVMGIDFFTLSKARRLVEKKVIEAGGMTPSSVEAIVKEKVGTEVNAYLNENPETEFLNVKKTGAKGDGTTDDSVCFAEGVAGYVVNDGIYCVDATTMARLNSKNCIGNGYLKLLNPQQWGNDGTEKWYAPFDYTIAVKDLDNVLQKQMVSKGEANYFASLNRQNATAMLKPLEGECYAHTIGAIYKIQGAVLPDKFTVCIGNLQLYLVGSNMLLKRIRVDKNLKTGHFGFFELPWVPETSRSVISDKYKVYDDHTEFYLTSEDFDGHAEGKTESVLHFWGGEADIGNRDDIIGVIACFDFWVKEEEARDKLIVQIGVDQMDYNTKTIKQACSGHALKMETYPRTSWSTSMNRALLDLYVNPKQLDYLHSLPFDDTFGTYQVIKDTGEYEQKIVSVANGDMYLKLFDDSKNYRDLQVINPIKHMYLPYCNTNSGSTGTYCKIFSIPIIKDSAHRCVFKMDVVRQSSKKVFSNMSALLTILRDGSTTIDILSSNTSDKGIITVVTTDTNIDVYIKGIGWGYVVADIELMMYADIAMIRAINYDTDLFRIGAGTRSIMLEKWTAIDTTNCIVVESGVASPLEQRIAELESKIAELTTTTIE